MKNKIKEILTSSQFAKSAQKKMVAISNKLSTIQKCFIFFVPSFTLVIGGILTFIAPNLLLPVIATFFLVMGVVAGYAGWKMMQFFVKARAVLKRFEGGVVVQGLQVRNPTSSSASSTSAEDLLEALLDGAHIKDTILH